VNVEVFRRGILFFVKKTHDSAAKFEVGLTSFFGLARNFEHILLRETAATRPTTPAQEALGTQYIWHICQSPQQEKEEVYISNCREIFGRHLAVTI